MSEYQKELECENCEFKGTLYHNDGDAMFAGLWYCPVCGDMVEDENEEEEEEDFLDDDEDDDFCG